MVHKRYDNPKSNEKVVGEYPDALPRAVPGTGMRGRGAGLNPGNRFETVRLHVLGEHLDHVQQNNHASAPAAPSCSLQELETESLASHRIAEILPDKTQTIINRVQCTEMGFDWTLNPYRGCEHGCIYCYARPYHEYLGFSSGIDFETRIMAKFDAPQLLQQELAAPRWRGEMIVMSGITDCWQPIDEKLQLARQCLQILARCRQPVTILTRNARILRDLDLLEELAGHHAVRVCVSLTTLDHQLAAKMEPRASAPKDRLHTMKELVRAGVLVSAHLTPIIPGLTDRELPALLQAVADTGVQHAWYNLVRLPYQNKDLFVDWLNRHFPDRSAHVQSLLKQMYQGKLYDSRWETRFRGKGIFSDQIRQLFNVYSKRYGLRQKYHPLSSAAFRKPSLNGQLSLFS